MNGCIRRTYKSTKETEKDYYQTNPYMIEALKEWLIEEGLVEEELTVVDPCCGEKVIGKGLIDIFPNIVQFDKFAENCYREDFMEYNPKYKVDIIVFNPPYSNKYNFINKAMEISDKVFCLLPLNVSNYNMFHREFEDIPEFVGKILMAPKMFLDQTTDFRTGGTSQYAWYMWSKNNSTNYSLTWYKDLVKIKEEMENK